MTRQFQPPAGGPPQSPPPSVIPQQQESYSGGFFPGPGPGYPRRWAMCLYRYTYVWLNNGRSFWMYPVGRDREFIYGYRWNGFTWIWRPIRRDRVISFNCHRY